MTTWQELAITWRLQPERRSRSWRNTSENAREAIAEIQEDTQNLTDAVIHALWEKTLRKARREAESDIDIPVSPLSLTWQEVFEDEYTPDP